MGVMADGPLVDPGITDISREGQLMQANGVEAIRIVVYWADLQPHARRPDRLGSHRPLIAMAARNRTAVLPVVIRAPALGPGGPGEDRARLRAATPPTRRS